MPSDIYSKRVFCGRKKQALEDCPLKASELGKEEELLLEVMQLDGHEGNRGAGEVPREQFYRVKEHQETDSGASSHDLELAETK